MNISNYTAFGKDLCAVLALLEGTFDDKKWQAFLRQYFDEGVIQQILEKVEADLSFFRSQDPASKAYTDDQILSVRRGMLAIRAHRVFEAVLSLDASKIFEVEVLAKTVQVATSVEIHPQAKIKSGFAIDHGHGTVIGATTKIGKNVFCYHGVTMGASGRYRPKGRRHPKIGDDVFLGNGVQVLGPCLIKNKVSVGSDSMVIDAVVGENVRISPGVLVAKVRVPDNYIIFGFDALTRQFIGRKPNSDQKAETFELERIDITEYSE